jgi:hypothetical protein
MILHNIQVTGSLVLNGVDLNDVTGSEESVNALNEFTSSYNTGSFTGSFIGDGSGVFGIVSASHALNADNAISSSFAATASFADSFTVAGEIVAQTLNVQQVTSSVVYSSGSNVFGNSVLNTQQFTGSLQVSGSSHYLLGNVGIGTTSPVRLFTVDLGTSGDISHFEGQSNVHLRIGESGNNMYINANNGNATLEFQTNTVERMRIDSLGRVGIGISSSLTYPLTIQGETGVNNSYIHFVNATTGTAFTDGTQIGVPDGQSYLLINQREASDIRFNTGGGERMRIDSSGNVGIGQSTMIGTAAGRVALTMGGSTSAIINFGNAGVRWGGIYAASGDYSIYSDSLMRFEAGGSERMRIDSLGTVSFAASSALSSAVASIGHLSSNGYMYIKGGTGGLVIGDDSTASRIQIEDNSNIRFETAGSERMRIDSSGNVGIGTTSPTSLLTLKDNFTNGVAITLDRTVNAAVDNLFYVGVSSAGTTATDFLWLGTATTSFVVRGDGKVGIGTTSPEQNLHIFKGESNGAAANTDSSLILENNSNTYVQFLTPSSNESGLLFGDTDNDAGAITYSHSTDALSFRVNANSRMTILSSGNVGIGTTGPTDKLEVNGNIGIFGNKIYNGSASNSAGVSFPSSTTRIDGYNGITFHSSLTTVGSQTERMRITNGGDVGIGTISPSVALHVDKTGLQGMHAWFGKGFINIDTYHYPFAKVGISVNDNDGADTGAGIQFNTRNSADSNWIHGYIYQPQDGGLAFGTGGAGTTQASDKINLLPNGNVGIGVTSPSYKLDIGGSGRFSELLQVNGPAATTRADGHGISLFNGNQDYKISFDSQNGTAGLIRYNVDIAGSTAHGHTFSAGDFSATPTELMLIRADGRVGIGTTSPSTTLHVSSSNSQLVRITTSGALSSGFYDIVQILAANQTGGGLSLNIGKAESTKNLGKMAYIHSSNGSNSNRLAFGFYDADNLLNLTAGGNVGIGTTSPAQNLEVSSGGALTRMLVTNTNNAAVGAGIQLRVLSGVTQVSNATLRTDNVGNFQIFTGTSGETERVRINPSGYLKASNTGTYFNSTDVYHELVSNQANWTTLIGNTNANPFGILVEYSTNANGSSNFPFYFNVQNVGKRIAFRSDGGLENYQSNDVNLSDIRVKKDIALLDSYWDKFKALEVVTFKYKDQTHNDDNIGFIAQQVEAVAPEFISNEGWQQDEFDNEEEPLKAIYTADMYNAAIKVLQEAMIKIETLEAENATIKLRLEALEQA